jgi:hypothetical protein
MEEPVRRSEVSKAGEVMEEAIALSLEGDSPFPERAVFLDADAPYAGTEIVKASDEGSAVVLVAADGSSRILEPGRRIESRKAPRAA